jgi:hypothetical protein
MKKINLIIGFLTLTFTFSLAQLEDIDPDYLNTLNKRAGKIIDGLNLEDKDKADRVQEIIVIQYFELSKIHDFRDEKLKEIEELVDEEKEASKRNIEYESNSALYKLHAEYLAKLSAELTQKQVEMVKCGMTYEIVERTYAGYLALLPDLTDEQKRYIYKNLIEAREFAMDAGSSEAKYAWFGKYKGRINNYLSAEGYNLKEAEQQLMNR